MKKILLLAILFSELCFANNSNVECSGTGLYFFPIESEISLNSKFIIEGYAFSQKTINNLKHKNVYLEDYNKNKIELEIIEILKGEMEITQAILKPKHQLLPNTTYFLKISELNEIDENNLYKWNSITNKREPIFWKTKDVVYNNLLNENLELEYYKDEATLYGCGPAVYSVFKIKNADKDEIWYKTEVVNIKTNRKTTYILVSKDEKLNVGHGMCAGAFTFSDHGKYKVRFLPMNKDGKINKPTRWITIKNPNNEKAYGF